MNTVHRFMTTSLLLLTTTTATHSDGIPVTPDRKDVTADCFTIQLNEAQVKQVERLRTVTLTEAQHAPLLAIYDKAPATFEVVSSRYDSCTCFLDLYGIWCRPGELKVPKASVNDQAEEDDYREKYPDDAAELDAEPDPDRYDSRKYVLDSAGRIYANGKEVQESEVLATIEALNERRKVNPQLRCSLVFDPPPPLDETTDTAINALARRMKAACEQRHIAFWASGLDLSEASPN